ncbi:helix-turn-helix domain-containing protein [Pseudarthrobacter sp. R1]|uniref:helix-turn-helix domain-containing protein n=1 Tax=Pseudarthrobacter sp. R1 TaxID=2944934 RepID=UPI00210DB44D|nr:helix-turn-helix domain-containing protein [Pseudarthrobacter sp. R1]MCQ6269388.1 helix-turn-helix domain-containing protein [Pseudarthrobacter sp. R1]
MSPSDAHKQAGRMRHFYTVETTSRVLGISEAEVMKMLESGELRGLRLMPPTPWLVDGRALDEFALHWWNNRPHDQQRPGRHPGNQE